MDSGTFKERSGSELCVCHQSLKWYVGIYSGVDTDIQGKEIFSAQSNQKKIDKIMNSPEHQLK